jgi:nucleotide-binding universal stress UspA family protein
VPVFKSIVVGTDGSDTATTAVVTAIDLAALCGAELHIVTAFKVKSLSAPDASSEFRYLSSTDEADALLSEVASRAKMAGVATRTHAATKDAVDSILEVARDADGDLIVVGNKGMKGARRVLGSIPNAISHQAPCSVLIVDTT